MPVLYETGDVIGGVPRLRSAPVAAPAGISFVGAGPVATAVATNVTPALPSGVQSGDLLVIMTLGGPTGQPGTAVASGYTIARNSFSAAVHKFRLLYKIAGGSETAPTVTIHTSVEPLLAQVAAFRGTHATPVDATSGSDGTQLAAQDIGPIASITPTVASSLAIVGGAKIDDWTSAATLTGDSLTWVEIGEHSQDFGGDGMRSFAWDYALNAPASAMSAKTFTVTGGSSTDWAGFAASFKPA